MRNPLKDKNLISIIKKPMRSVGGRFTIIISIAILGCLLIIELVSFTTMRSIVTKNGQEKLSIACDKIQSALDEDYSSMMYISQSMTSTGVAGKLFDTYCESKTLAEHFETSEELKKMMSNLLFTTGDAFAVYYDQVRNINHLDAIQRLKAGGLLPENLPVVHRTSSVDYHAVHNSRNRFGKPQAVSISRKSISKVDPDVIAYIEIPVSMDDVLEELSDNNESGYILVQLDDAGKVSYSSSKEIAIDSDMSELINTKESFGKYHKLMWNISRSVYGYYTVILQPTFKFYQDAYNVGNALAIGIVVTILLIAAVLILLDRLVLKKNAVVLQEIERVGPGNLDLIETRTGLDDYDNLIEKFNRMLSRIHLLIQDVEIKERERSELEREIMYYQINPHFLLNSLNSAFWLSKSGDRAMLDDYLSQLTGILRYSLGKDNETPTFRKDLEVMKQYLKLQQYRHDFNYSLDIEEGDYLDNTVPRLFIQPVLENSIEHGMDEDGDLHIVIKREGPQVKVTVTDNGIGVPQELIDHMKDPDSNKKGKIGIGLRYVRTMLRSRFGDSAFIRLENIVSDSEKGTRVIIEFPVEKEV